MSENLQDTQFFRAIPENKMDVSQVSQLVYEALSEKGYNPVNQIVGYVMSGAPTYIPTHNSATRLIMKADPAAILDELPTFYIEQKFDGGK